MVRLSDFAKDKPVPADGKGRDAAWADATEEKVKNVNVERQPGLNFKTIMYPMLRGKMEGGGLTVSPPTPLREDDTAPEGVQPVAEVESPRPATTMPIDTPLEEVFRGPGDDEVMYENFRRYMNYVANRVKEDRDFDSGAALVLVNEFLASGMAIYDKIYQLTIDSDKESNYYITHPINVMVYALKLGEQMGYAKSKMIELALAALFHDVGIFKIREDIINKKAALTDAEMALIKRHPEMGVEILSFDKEQNPLILRAVYEHHERENGQGYPRGLKGNEISEYAQILGICDSYEAMTHDRPHRSAFLETVSVRELISARSQMFSPTVTKAFVNGISIYPVGSYVRLNNRNIGKVISTNRANPFRPIVMVMYDDKGRRLTEPRIVDLKNTDIINIEMGISKGEIPP